MGGKYYVYEHWRADRNECFYVGKGHGRRAYDMRRGRNRWHKFLQTKLSTLGTAIEIKIVADGMTEEEAFKFEIDRIAFWKNDGADLCNLTLGGEGPSGYKFSEERKLAASLKSKGRKHSAEARAKLSAAAIGNKRATGCKRARHLVEALIARNTGRVVSEETCRKISASKRGQVRLHTPEEDARASARQKGVPKSEETKSRMRKPKSAAHCEKIRACMTGVKRSSETRAKIAENSRNMWAQRRAAKACELQE